MNLQRNFIAFHNAIVFNRPENRKRLTVKREQLVADIRRYLSSISLPKIVEVYNQGSYAVGTGIKPVGGSGFDIDVALVFKVKIKDYKDPTVIKQWVKKGIDAYSHGQAEILPACVRVDFDNYHIDFACYGYDDHQRKYIAKGQKGSQPNNKYWEASPSAKLKKKLQKTQIPPLHAAQYKRLICYLKRWKDCKFRLKTNEKPTGIALTVMAYHWFQPQVKGGKENDLKALNVVLEQAKLNNYGLDIRLPESPHNSLFKEINQSENHRKKYIKRMKELCQAVKEAYNENDEHRAASILQAQFGSDFPL